MRPPPAPPYVWGAPKRGHAARNAILIVIGLFVVLAAVGSNLSRGTTKPTATPTAFVPPAHQLGDVVTIDRDNQRFTITVSDVHEDAALGYWKPSTTGFVFVSAMVTYQAQSDGVSYNPSDWSGFCDGRSIDQSITTRAPDLGSGDLFAGRSASGYVTFAAPATGEVRFSYTFTWTDTTPTFEVIVRPS
jgi:hypothetical protein